MKPVGPLYNNNGCFRVVDLGDGSWYFLDECDPNANWSTGKAGEKMGKLLTFGDTFAGTCHYTSHSQKSRACPGFTESVFSNNVRCTVDHG